MGSASAVFALASFTQLVHPLLQLPERTSFYERNEPLDDDVIAILQSVYYVLMTLCFEASLTCMLGCALLFAHINYLPLSNGIEMFIREHERSFVLPEAAFIAGAWIMGLALPFRALVLFGISSPVPWVALAVILGGGTFGAIFAIRIARVQRKISSTPKGKV